MNKSDINKIAKRSAKKLGLPSRNKRIVKEWATDVWLDIWLRYAIFMDKMERKAKKRKCGNIHK